MPTVSKMTRQQNELIAIRDIPTSVPGVGLIKEGQPVPREVPKEVVQQWLKQKPAIVMPKNEAGDEGWWNNDFDFGERRESDPLGGPVTEDQEVLASRQREQEQRESLHAAVGDSDEAGMTAIDRAQREAAQRPIRNEIERQQSVRDVKDDRTPKGKVTNPVDEAHRDQMTREQRENVDEVQFTGEKGKHKIVDDAIVAGENVNPSPSNVNLLPEQTPKDTPKSVQEMHVQENAQIPVNTEAKTDGDPSANRPETGTTAPKRPHVGRK